MSRHCSQRHRPCSDLYAVRTTRWSSTTRKGNTLAGQRNMIRGHLDSTFPNEKFFSISILPEHRESQQPSWPQILLPQSSPGPVRSIRARARWPISLTPRLHTTGTEHSQRSRFALSARSRKLHGKCGKQQREQHENPQIDGLPERSHTNAIRCCVNSSQPQLFG